MANGATQIGCTIAYCAKDHYAFYFNKIQKTWQTEERECLMIEPSTVQMAEMMSIETTAG